MKFSTLLLAGTAFLLGATAVANPLSPEPVIVKEHNIRINGKKIAYKTEAGRVPIRDTRTGEPHGFMYYTAYKVDSKEPRPVMFIWNGGPGAPSTILHFEAFGPKRLEDGQLVTNHETLLPVADMVFVDPIGTGFSRPTKPEYAKEFYGTLSDVTSVTEFVRAWRLLNGAEKSPLYFMGESWGAGRAGKVGLALQKMDIPVSGLVLLSGGGISTDQPRNVNLALRMVSRIRATAHHGKLPAEYAKDLDKTLSDAVIWANDVYAPALADVNGLSAEQKTDIAERVAIYSGVPVEDVNPETLRVTPRQFRESLLRDEGRTLDIFDMRISYGKEDAPIEDASAEVMLDYIRHEVGYTSDLPYIGLDQFSDGFSPDGSRPPTVGEQWDWFTVRMTDEEKKAAFAEAVRVGGGPPRGGPPLPGANELVALNPDVDILVASGAFDSLASCFGDEEASTRLTPQEADAIEYKCYIGGHMMYRDEVTRKAFSADVIELMTP